MDAGPLAPSARHRASPGAGTYPSDVRTVTSTTDGFPLALERLRSVTARPEFRLDETPAPQRLAPFAAALTAEPVVDEPLATGRFVLLHDPDGVEEWEGTYRAVVFVRAALEQDLVDDPLIHEVGWSWLLDSLHGVDAEVVQLGGTVTRTSGQSFGTMHERPVDGFVEIRASWTPAGPAPVEQWMDRHVRAWTDLLCLCSGLPPIPEGVAAVRPRRSRA